MSFFSEMPLISRLASATKDTKALVVQSQTALVSQTATTTENVRPSLTLKTYLTSSTSD